METSTSELWNESNKKYGIITEESIGSDTKFSLSKQDKLILLAMASLSLMAALDGTSISVALPVFASEVFLSTRMVNSDMKRI